MRYWETEFPILKPGKTPSRHRLYRRRDVELLLEIKRLLYEEGFTIAGAKKQLKDSEAATVQLSQDQTPPLPSSDSEMEESQQNTPPPGPAIFEPPSDQRQLLREIREDLQALYKMLANKST